MEVNTNNPVGNGIQGPGKAQKISVVKPEKDKTPDQQATQTKENPDYRLSLSDTSQKAVSEPAKAQATGPAEGKADLSEDEAARIAQQASEQLSQTNAAISNQAIQKAVDLFA